MRCPIAVLAPTTFTDAMTCHAIDEKQPLC